MNYNSIDDILAAGITNMTALRTNTKQDDGADAITGVNWFTFNGSAISTIYVSGNSWLGFGSQSEHLKVNRRDGAMYYLYREEGTLYDYFRFLKIRWSGYTAYNNTATAYKLEYDVILWDTGDISLHIVTWPTSYNTGTYSLVASSTYTYKVSSSSTDVTFKKTDNGFEVQNNVIALELPYAIRYLLRDGTTIYTVVNGALSSLGASEITSDLFLNSGTKVIPDFSLLSGLSNPELLYWHDKEDPVTELVVYGSPTLPQIVLYEEQRRGTNAIEQIEVAASDDALFSITVDGGITWKYYHGNDWVNTSSLSDGMNKETIKALTSAEWNVCISSGTTFQFRCTLPTLDSYTGSVAVGYSNNSSGGA